MITISQLLESVDLDFEPRFVTKDGNGTITVYLEKPIPERIECLWDNLTHEYKTLGPIKLSEFDGKDWTDCIYEVPRKTTEELKKIEIMPRGEHTTVLSLFDIALKVNEIIDKIETLEERTEDVAARIIEVERAVNELKGAKNE